MRGLTRWQWITLVMLTTGYAGYYFCRSNFSVATPLLLEEFGPDGLDKAGIGRIASIGLLFYVAGKLLNGVAADFGGGRNIFLFGMAASVGATVVFGLGSGLTVFLVAWCVNRFVQSMGWGALVKTASVWFPADKMGTLTGVLCLSYLFGDVIAKLVLGQIVEQGVGWRGMYFVAAGVLAVLFLAGLVLLKSRPEDVGEISPPAKAENVFGDKGNEDRPLNLRDLLGPLLASAAFWLVATMNFGLTLVRETLNFWTPTYLNEVLAMSPGTAAQASSLFPFFGGISVLMADYLSDRVGGGRRGGVMVLFLVPATMAMFGLSLLNENSPAMLALIIISLIGFLTLGPYAFLSGAVAVDLGGKRGSATAAGIADAIGYLGGVLSGEAVGLIADRWGWASAFASLGGVLVFTTAVGAFYWLFHERRAPAVVT